MASGAGLNRVGSSGAVPLLTVNPSSTANASPLTTIGNAGNDSAATGMFMVEGAGFSKVGFQVVAARGSTTFSGYSITFFGTNDHRAYDVWRSSFDPMAFYGQPAPTLPASSWFQIPALTDQSGTGADTNPITAPGGVLATSRGLVAVRAVLTAISGGPTGCAQAQAFAIP